jgi:hypothetical protein
LNNPRMRDQSGEHNYRSRLTEKQVLAIFHSTQDPATLAQTYRVTACTIRDIRTRRTWRYLTRGLTP